MFIPMDLQMFTTNTTDNTTTVKGKDVLDPQVLAAMIQAKYDGALKFHVLAASDSTLVGVPGSTITVPSWNMMDDIEGTIDELGEIPVDKITHSTREVTIKKIGKGFAITDEAKEIGIGDPAGEGMRQLGMLFPKRLDQDLVDALLTTSNTGTATLDYDGVADAKDKFEMEDDHHLILFLNPADASVLRKNMAKSLISTEVGANALINGTYMDIDGVEIVKTAKMTKGTAVMVKVGNYENEANNDPVLKIIQKTPVKVEYERDASHQVDNYYGSSMYGVYLYNEARALKLTVSAPAPEEPVA